MGSPPEASTQHGLHGSPSQVPRSSGMRGKNGRSGGHRGRKALENCGELHWMLQTKGVRESLIADRHILQRSQEALNVVSLALVIVTNVRARDADAAGRAGVSAREWRPSGARLQADSRLPEAPPTRGCAWKCEVEATMSFVSSQHAENFTLHTSPLKEELRLNG